MQSTMMKLETFQVWNKKSKPYAQYEQIKKKMLSNIAYIKQEDANILAGQLNQMIANASFSDQKIMQHLLNKLPSVIKRGAQEGISNLEVKPGMKVTSSESSVAWVQYYTAYNRLKAEENMTEQQLRNNEELNTLRRVAQQAQGKISNIQGDIFEAFLQEAVPLLAEKTKQLGENELNQLIGDLKKSIESKSIIETQGNESETITFQFGEDSIKISSKGKIDVSLPAPFLSTDFPLNISAKNYRNLQAIHLLGGGSVLGLISQWPTSENNKNYFVNALTIYDAPEKLLQYGKMLFAIQSLAGHKGQKEMANVLILNIGNKKTNPIRIISIGALLQNLGLENIDSIFTMKYSSQIPLFSQGSIRTKKEFTKRIKSLTLDTTLNKQILYMSYINKLKTK